MTRRLPRLHAITNDEVLTCPDFGNRVVELDAVTDFAVHIRSGSLGGRSLTEIAESTQRACSCGTVVVNDRVDVARIVGAGGVHLPSAGLSVAHARRILGPDCWIGRSTHTPREVARAAEEGADYVFLGPIWPTASHPNTEPLGPYALTMVEEIPIIAIGGITPERVSTCLENGAHGVAVISSLWYAHDVASAARALSLSFPT